MPSANNKGITMTTVIRQTTSERPLSPNDGPEDWENWEDEDVITPIDPSEQVLISPPAYDPAPARRTTKPVNKRLSRNSVSNTRINRLKSRHRQKAQNAKAGIKLITDMTAWGRQDQMARQLQIPDGRPVKFVDAAALKALEGEPNSASVGNWNWLRRNKNLSPSSATPGGFTQSPEQLTPGDRPIMIGIALPSEQASQADQTPRSAVSDTARRPYPDQQLIAQNARGQQVSVWSPDTPETANSSQYFHPGSSVHSQATTATGFQGSCEANTPPVPTLPPSYKKTHHQRLISLESGNGDDDDTGTPCTLFEEDGISSPSSKTNAKASAATPTLDSAGSRMNGWWDHVVTPFMDKRFTFASRKQKLESPSETLENDHIRSAGPAAIEEKDPYPVYLTVPKVATQAPIVRAPTPRARTPAPQMTDEIGESSVTSSARSSSTIREADITDEKMPSLFRNVSADIPPPYSPPNKQLSAPIRYRAVFPPGHPLHNQFPPSPGPASPGLAATMTSQGATQMTDIPITPGVNSNMILPNRPIGTFLPHEYSHDERCDVHRVERQRRRHEKEDVVARKAGGLWRGRGCIPAKGCFGRTGPEGRKRRRVCLAIFGAIMFLVTLAVVLAVVLTRPRGAEEVPSIWVNLTDFPPMPTGVLTVVGPDNTIAKSGCTAPSTLWSCALPKEEHDSVAPHGPNQPTVVLQIQWDNSTRRSWDVPDDAAPDSISRRSMGGSTRANYPQRRQATEFEPRPGPPSFEDMWFLGETTDDVSSDDKAGEVTPFFISILESANETISAPQLEKRQDNKVGDTIIRDILPPPDLLDDGTPAPAVMLPKVVQQPVRLYDRGLPTERYAFYTYFQRTIYLKSTARNETDIDAVPLDEDGGCRKSEADFLATWGETRMLVQIWTRKLNDTSLIKGEEGDDASQDTELIRPGTMPYPVTVTLDTHGGKPTQKLVWQWPMDNRQLLNLDDPKLMANNMEFGGMRINPGPTGDKKFGGFDGGTGGCKCEWVNWV